MPNPSLLSEIQTRFQSLTKAEKKVASFVLEHPQQALNATITDLSEFCQVGETSVFRFCRSMDLAGYQDFKLSLALSTSTHGMPDLGLGENLTSRQPQDICAFIQRCSVDAIATAAQMLPPAGIERAVQLLLEAKRIHFFGLGGSGISALEAHNKFMKITEKAAFSADSHMQMTTAAILGKDALAVIFSNSGTTKDAISIARLACQSGAKVLFITAFPKTPAGKFCDLVLACGTQEGPMQGGSVEVKMYQHFVINVLYTAFFRAMGEKAHEKKAITAGAITSEML